MAVCFGEMEEQLRVAVRMSESSFLGFRNELIGLFNACIEDLKGAGADISKNENLVKQAVIFYCKANFGLETDEKWQTLYEKTRDALGSRTSEIEEAAT